MEKFTTERLIARCRAAARESSEPWLRVLAIFADELRDIDSIHAALPVTKAELVPLYIGTDVTITKVVWAPGMYFPPHDHLTWACIGLYSGCERNVLYRLKNGELRQSDEFLIAEGEARVLAEDAIHAVSNPSPDDLSAALHVYGGHFPSLPRSNWIGDPLRRVAADIESTKKFFAAANS